jgi:hypothetical protein
MTQDLSLREFLSVPYLVEAEAIEIGPGDWLRRAAHPELPDCWAEAPRIVDTLHQLERRRIEVIVELLRRGTAPPVPRPPLEDADPEGVLVRHGLRGELAPLLDLPGSEIARR